MSSAEIFVINLDRAIERLDFIKSQFEKLEMSFKRIPAVDAKAVGKEFLYKHYSEKLNKKNYYRSLKNEEIACYISHLYACKEIVKRNLDYAVILEDDIILESSFKYVHNILRSIKDWNYIKLISPFKQKKITSQKPIIFNIPTTLHKKSYKFNNIEISNSKHKVNAPMFFSMVSWEKPPVGTQAYAITLQGAKEFLEKRSIFAQPIDVDLQFLWETKLNIKGIQPNLCKISNMESSINDRKIKYHYPFARIIYKLKYALSFYIK